MRSFKYNAISPKQGNQHKVFGICCRASDVLKFAEIDRIGREQNGTLRGFQRSQVQSHIVEIKEYLQRSDAILPNAIVVAFTSNVNIKKVEGGLAAIEISVPANRKPGLVVDGQQRLTALSLMENQDFEIFVNCLVCESEDELRRQFILINNTRPLPKSLIYELLPSVDALPSRLSIRTDAARLTEMLNHDESSSLRGQIKQHTHPDGVIQDSVFQRMLMHSLSDGILHDLMNASENGLLHCFRVVSDFFSAVQSVFASEWIDHTPRTSRLVHGSGVIAMGFVMEEILGTDKKYTTDVFEKKLRLLQPNCAWTAGNWNFGPGEVRKWNDLQVIPKDYLQLTSFLIRIMRRESSHPHEDHLIAAAS
jgi:DGQHR domain-containing protein